MCIRDSDNPSTDPTNPTNPTDPTNPTNPTEPKVYPVATPITDTEAQPATIGSYQRKNGYFTWSVTSLGVNREIEVYIPKGARQREFWIGITLPAGVTSNEFLGDAGWFDIADDSLACLLIMKPDSSGKCCLLYTSPSPRDLSTSRMPSSA